MTCKRNAIGCADLGSNSFRPEIEGWTTVVLRTEYLKEPSSPGQWPDADQPDAVAMQRGWDCLARFAERLAWFDKPQNRQVRAVATQTLRGAQPDEFLARFTRILGFHYVISCTRRSSG
jgi:exopolyphosphatase/guanosine-5'-triphosphate,3'-diphosphate pyrophosphatase